MDSLRVFAHISDAVYLPPEVPAHLQLNFAQDGLKDALKVTFVGTLRLVSRNLSFPWLPQGFRLTLYSRTMSQR
jgi:hypothetical protein